MTETDVKRILGRYRIARCKKLEAQRAAEKAKERAAKKVNPVREGIQKRRAQAKQERERRDEFFRKQREKERKNKGNQ